MKRSRSWGQGRCFKQAGTERWSIEYSIPGPEGKRKRKIEATGSLKRADALALLRLRNSQLDAGSFVAPAVAKTVRLSTLEKLVTDDYKANGQRSLESIRCAFRLLKGYFVGDPVVSQITPMAIAEFRAAMLVTKVPWRTTTYKPATINRSQSALTRGFRIARELKMVIEVPTAKHLYEGDNVREGFVQPADFRRLLEKLPAELRDIIGFLYESGWRSGEAKSLKWSDVVDESIRLRPANSKTKTARVLPLTGKLAEIIERARAHRAEVAKENEVLCEFVFHRNGGQQIKDFRVAFNTACKAVGLNGTIPHDFRRSAVKNLRDANVSELEAMRITGHTSRLVFDRYHIVTDGDIRAALEKRDAFLRQQTDGGQRVVPIRGDRAAS